MNFAPHFDKRAPHLRQQTAGPLSCLAQNSLRKKLFFTAEKGQKGQKEQTEQKGHFKIQNSKFASFFTGIKKDTREKRMDRKSRKGI